MDVIQVSLVLPSLETFTQIRPTDPGCGLQTNTFWVPLDQVSSAVQDLTTVWMLKGILADGSENQCTSNLYLQREWRAVKPFGLALYLGLLNFLLISCRLQSKAWLKKRSYSQTVQGSLLDVRVMARLERLLPAGRGTSLEKCRDLVWKGKIQINIRVLKDSLMDNKYLTSSGAVWNATFHPV